MHVSDTRSSCISKSLLRREEDLKDQQRDFWFVSHRYQFFLQIKQDILQGRLPVSFDLAAELGAYVVQCKIFFFLIWKYVFKVRASY